MAWCTVESDPGVFTELIGLLGVKDVDVQEIYSLDSSEQHNKEQSYGLIFLFKYVQETDTRTVIDATDVPDLFFARQIVQDACATQAILSILLNSPSIDIGTTLADFKDFTCTLDSETKGIAIGNSDDIRLAHNSFSRPEPFLSENSKFNTGKAEDVYHFVAYVPFGGVVYEMDGLKAGPIRLGTYTGEDWLSVARPAVEERMMRYSSAETHFALMSVNKKRSTVLEAQIETLQQGLDSTQRSSADDPDIQAQLAPVIEDLQQQLAAVRMDLADEVAKIDRQKAENVRRRHNYIPFIVALLRILSTRGALQPLIESGKVRARTRHEAEESRKK